MIYHFKIVKENDSLDIYNKRIYFEFQFEKDGKNYISHCDVSRDNKNYIFPGSYGHSTEDAYTERLKLDESKALKIEFLNDPKIRLRRLLNPPEKIRVYDREGDKRYIEF